MKYKTAMLAAVVASILALGGCGGGGGGSSSSTGVVLDGSWLGTTHLSGIYYKMAVSVDTANQISNVYRNDSPLGLTGSITHLTDLAYRFALNVGDVGGFLIDSSATHAGFLNLANGEFGVLQRNATGLATSYALSDLNGTWSGYSVALDASGNIVNYSSSNATVTDGNFTGTGPYGTFTGFVVLDQATYGGYNGVYNTTGSVRLFLSPDKTFAASWACDTGFPPYGSCSYNSWSKQ